MMAKCTARLIQRPSVLGSLALAYGYLSGYLKNIPQVGDEDLSGTLALNKCVAYWAPNDLALVQDGIVRYAARER